MSAAHITPIELEQFKASWPCHGFPDSLYQLWFYFADNGDLVDITATSEKGRDMDSAAFDGPALAALADDARVKLALGEESI